MKQIKLLFTILFMSVFLGQAQTMYVMKNGSSVAEYDVSATGLDSVIFYKPTPPTTNVPFYDLTNKTFGKSPQTGTVAQGFFAANGMFKQYVWQSDAAGGLAGFDVVLPANYDTSTKRYPVIFHLHGHGEAQSAYSYNGNLSSNLPSWWSSAQLDEFIFVSVGGPAECWWSDGANGVKAESHIINELLSVVDQKFRTLGTREGRCIEGFSMGGFGASKIGMKYPQYFAAVGTYCGAVYNFKTMAEDSVQGFRYPGNYTSIWQDNKTLYAVDCARQIMTTSQAAKVISQGTHFVVHAGEGDALYYPINNLGWAPDLATYKIPHTYTHASGGHDMGNAAATLQYYKNLLSHLTY